MDNECQMHVTIDWSGSWMKISELCFFIGTHACIHTHIHAPLCMSVYTRTHIHITHATRPNSHPWCQAQLTHLWVTQLSYQDKEEWNEREKSRAEVLSLAGDTWCGRISVWLREVFCSRTSMRGFNWKMRNMDSFWAPKVNGNNCLHWMKCCMIFPNDGFDSWLWPNPTLDNWLPKWAG